MYRNPTDGPEQCWPDAVYTTTALGELVSAAEKVLTTFWHRCTDSDSRAALTELRDSLENFWRETA